MRATNTPEREEVPPPKMLRERASRLKILARNRVLAVGVLGRDCGPIWNLKGPYCWTDRACQRRAEGKMKGRTNWFEVHDLEWQKCR